MLRIVFMGTPEFSVPILEALIKEYNVVMVVTQPDKEVGRKREIVCSPVKKCALEHDIPVFQPTKIRVDYQPILDANPDLIVTAAYGQIVGMKLLNAPKYRSINVHASLLPKYRGGAPIHYSVINGDKETGICTMITELGLDCGDICQKLVIPISATMNCEELWNEIAEKSPKMIEQTLIGLTNGTLTPEKQCEDGVCMANKLTKEECEIDWCKSNIQIHNLVRGVWRCPSAFFYYNDKLIKVIETTPLNDEIPTGTVRINSKDGIDVGCGIGAIRLLKVKPEGKGEMPARDWFNGVKKG